MLSSKAFILLLLASSGMRKWNLHPIKEGRSFWDQPSINPYDCLFLLQLQQGIILRDIGDKLTGIDLDIPLEIGSHGLHVSVILMYSFKAMENLV